jgi:hypothetical protein
VSASVNEQGFAALIKHLFLQNGNGRIVTRDVASGRRIAREYSNSFVRWQLLVYLSDS